MPEEQNNWYNIKMKDGEVFKINEEQYQTMKECLSIEYKSRPDFIYLGEGKIIAVDYIAHIRMEGGLAYAKRTK